MKRRNLVILSVVAVLLFVAAISQLLPTGPRYRGKSARTWVNEFQRDKVSYADMVLASRQMGEAAVPFLLDGLKREETSLRKLQRKLWGKLPVSLQTRFPLSAPPKFTQYQVCVVNIVKEIGPGSTPGLIKALRSGRPEVRETVAWTLGGFKTNAHTVVPALTKALGDPDALVRLYAAGSLGEFGPVAAEAVPALIVRLHDSDQGSKGGAVFVRGWSILALGKIGPPAHAAIPALRELIKGSDNRLVVYSAIAIWQIDRDAESSLPILASRFSTWDDHEKWKLLQTFGDMGTNATSVVPMLCEYLRKIADKEGFPSTEIRQETIKALRKIDSEAAARVSDELHIK